jgi:predicted nucleic acid-binding protein
VSVITAFETFQNCRSPEEEVAVDQLFDRIVPRELTLESARLAGGLMRSHGSVFSSDRTAPDALIAASAIVDDAILVTLNVRQFARAALPGLTTLVIEQDAADWTASLA